MRVGQRNGDIAVDNDNLPLIHKDYPVVKTFKAGLTVRLFPRLFGIEGAENVLAAVNPVAVEFICSDAFDDKA